MIRPFFSPDSQEASNRWPRALQEHQDGMSESELSGADPLARKMLQSLSRRDGK
jgi:hypothetical protein